MLKWFKSFFRGVDTGVTFDQVLESLIRRSGSAAGVAVNETTVLGNPAIFSGVWQMSQWVGKTPCNVYRKDAAGDREIDEFHPAHWLLRYEPSKVYTPERFYSALVANALIYGNGYAEIVRDPDTARPLELILLNPSTMRLDVRRSRYIETRDGQNIQHLPENIFHIVGLTLDGLNGLSILDYCRDALGLGLALQKHGAFFFKNNARPNLLLKTMITDKEKARQLITDWNSIHGGVENSNKTGILYGGLDVAGQVAPANNEDAQFLQSREHDIAMSANVLGGIPPHKLGLKGWSSFASLVEQQQSYLDSLDPWFVKIEQEGWKKLLTETQKVRGTHFIEFNRKALVRLDPKLESELVMAQVESGLRSEESARRVLNIPPKDESETYRSEPAPAPQEQQPAEEPVQETGDTSAAKDSDQQQKLRALTGSTLERLFKRIERDTKPDLQNHRAVFDDSLAAFPNAPDVIGPIFEELKAVLPEQRKSVLARINMNELVEQLC